MRCHHDTHADMQDCFDDLGTYLGKVVPKVSIPPVLVPSNMWIPVCFIGQGR